MYFISIIYGVNTRLALGEFLKYANYFFIFLLARDLVVNKSRQRWLLNTLLLSGVVVSIIGIGSAIGTWDYNGAFVSGRINSSFQYPNTLASYLGALIIISLGLTLIENKRIYKGIYGGISGVFIFTFILTYSRGMWLMLPLMILLFFILIPNKRKLEGIAYSVLASFGSIPLAFLFSQRIESKSLSLWILVIGAFCVSGLLVYLISFIESKLRSVSIKKLLIGVSIIASIAILASIYALNATTPLTFSHISDKDIPSAIIRNVSEIEPNTEYNLDIKYSGINNSDKSSIGRVRVYSVNTEGKSRRIDFIDINDLNNQSLNKPVTTFDDTKSIRIILDNPYVGTSITFDKVTLLDKDNEETIKNLKLKYRYIPEKIVSRLGGINMEENSVQARLAFYTDGFKVIKKYPALGTGGGGWATLYQGYQSYFYSSTQAHNYFLQLWIEVGIIGLLLFLGILVFLIYYIYKKYIVMEDEVDKVFIITIFISIISILSHAFMDFDLSLSALTFVLWSLMGVLASNIKSEKINGWKVNKSTLLRAGSIVFVCILVMISSSLVIANNYINKGLAAHKSNNIDEAIRYFEKASTFDPYKVEYKNDLATFYKVKYQFTNESKYILKAKELTDQVADLASYSSRFNALSASFYLSVGEIEKGLDMIDRSVKLQPMRVENYVQKIDAYLAAFGYYLNQKGDIAKAEEIISKAYTIKEEINNINKIALKPLAYNEDLVYKIGDVQFYYENLNDSEYQVDDNYALDFAYYFDLDINNDENIDMLRVWNSEKGNAKYELVKNKESYIRITNDGESYGLVYPYGQKLEPNTKYKVYFKAKGTVNQETFNFYVYDNNAKNKSQASLANIDLTNQWEIFSIDFKTDLDIVPGTQYLRFQHNGSDEGHIDLEEVVIFKEIE